jgi:hypothetical protein
MTAEIAAAIASVIAAVFAVLGFLYGVYVRWPRLSRLSGAVISSSTRRAREGRRSAHVEIANVGGSTARHAEVIVKLDGRTLYQGTASIGPEGVWCRDRS